jgi:1,4-alpha-glucan branching enzyme
MSHTPFEELAQFPEKLAAALNTAKVENDIFAASHKARTKRATRSAVSKNGNNNLWKSPEYSLIELKQIEFTFEAPRAKSVKLAADFTDWEKYPLDMIQSENGVWFIVVPLAPGNYSYRFIVDGQWCDDPRSNLHIQNPFGTNNAIRQVA